MALTLFININELTDEQYEREMDFLCPQKRERVLKIRFEDDKKRSLAANFAARRAAADFFGTDEDEIRITCDGSGKPLCDGCYISLSHSGDYAVCAVSSFPIGVDIEKKRDVNPKLINKICVNDAEGEYATDTQSLLTLWSVKEACFKALSPKVSTVSDISLEITERGFECGGISFIETGIVHKDYVFSLASV